jgi:Niemann-Pick C1 protein
MFVYFSFALGRFKGFSRLFIDSRFTLGLLGIFVVLSSVLISTALFTALRVKTTLIIAEVIPFLVLAIGVDNIFIIVNTFDRTDHYLSVRERIGIALGRCGPSIFLTCATETVAFAIGGFVPMPAVSTFSLYAAVAIVTDFILQVTCFITFLALDSNRRNVSVYGFYNLEIAMGLLPMHCR